MTVKAVRKDLDQSTMSIEAEFSEASDRVWELWADPRRLERWWGPPGYPATVTEHALVVGGAVRYFMTGPEGERYHGGWNVTNVDEPYRLEFEDFFTDEDGRENLELPRTRTVVSIDDDSGTTRMRIESHFPSSEAMAQMLEMGMEEGIRMAVGQADAILAELPR